MLKQRFLIVFSRIANIIYRKNFQFEGVKISPPILIENNPMYLTFEIDGCYKIKIKDIGVFVGTRKTIKIKTPSNGKLEIILYGRKKKISKKISFDVVNFHNVKTPEKVEISPLKMIHIEQFKNLKRVNLVSGITSFQKRVGVELLNRKVSLFNNSKPTIHKELNANKVNIIIDKSIIKNYEKTIL
jgi:hypothetical protein